MHGLGRGIEMELYQPHFLLSLE